MPNRRLRTGRASSSRGAIVSVAAVVLTVAAACSSDAPRTVQAPGEGEGVATTSLTTTTLQDLDDLVNATDRPPMPTLPAGEGAAADVTGQISAIVGAIERRDGPYTGAPGALVDAIAQELLGGFTGCDVAPSADATTTGVGPAIGTIDIRFGCDPTTDRLQYVLTLASPGAAENATEGWSVTAATRTPHCVRGVSEGLCA